MVPAPAALVEYVDAFVSHAKKVLLVKNKKIARRKEVRSMFAARTVACPGLFKLCDGLT